MKKAELTSGMKAFHSSFFAAALIVAAPNSWRLFALSLILLFDLSPCARAQTLFGNALAFNGTNQYVTVPNFGNLIPTNEITIEFWANTAKFAGQSAFMLSPDQNNNRLNVHLNFGGSYGDAVTYWDFGNILGVGRVKVACPPNSISNWVHYAFVASQSGNYMAIYTNGVLQVRQSGMTPFTRGNYSLQIGGPGYPYNGALDELRMWSVARTQAQIQSDLFTRLTGSESDLVFYYRFDSGIGNVAINYASVTGLAYDGTLVNDPAWITSTVQIPTAVVSYTDDSGGVSLRGIVASALPGTVITFAPNLAGQTIQLFSGQIAVANNVTIDGSALAQPMQLNGRGASRIFYITNGATLNSLIITNGHESTDNGGGIINAGILTMSNCTLAGNSANYGGAIENQGNGVLTGCTLTGNQAIGGGAIDTGGTLTLSNCTLAANFSSTVGGAIENQSNCVLTCCTLNNNTTGQGAAVRNNAGQIELLQCTLYSNVDNFGAGPGGIDNYGGTIIVNNSIIAGNLAYDLFNFYSSTVVAGGTNIMHSHIDYGTFIGVSSFLDTNPLLAPLGDYGGPTQTMPPLPGSPAIDAGIDAVAGGIATDQRGYPRLAGAHVDIGAVEAQPAPTNNPPVLKNAVWSSASGGTFQFGFTNSAHIDFAVLTSPDVSLPLTNWTALGVIPEISPGVYQFTDPGATNSPQRFYRVVSP